MSRHVKIDEKFGWNESKLMRSLDAINPVQASIRPVPYVRVLTKQAARTHKTRSQTAGGVPSVFCYGWLAVDGKRPWNRAFYFRAQNTVDNNPQITPLAFLQQEHNIPRLVACIATFGVNFPSTWCGDTVFTPPAVTLGGGEAELGLRRHGTVE